VCRKSKQFDHSLFDSPSNPVKFTKRRQWTMLPSTRIFTSPSLVRTCRSFRVPFDQSFLRYYSIDPKDKQSSESIPFPKYNKQTYGADVKKFSQLPINFGANQHISIDEALKERLRSVLWKFNAPIRYAFAYGSGVFQQAGADPNAVRY
jgi:hypothetical protein